VAEAAFKPGLVLTKFLNMQFGIIQYTIRFFMLSQVPTLAVADNIQFTYQAIMQKLKREVKLELTTE
jgi:hypothetical protein